MNFPRNEWLKEPGSAGRATIPGWKRALDVTLILVSLPLLLPLMAAITVLIWIVSPGPVLFKQERVGFWGRRFLLFKFRTMVVDADTAVHQGHLNQLMSTDVPMEKMDARGDRRVIPLGLMLRSTGLDELPQLLNVLRGEMSLVGPRPCLPFEYERYVHCQKERFTTMPGLTGLWQVSGKNRTTFTEMVQLDIEYARKQSLWLDLKVMVKTLPAVIEQVQDTRKRKKSRSPSARSGAAISAQAANQ